MDRFPDYTQNNGNLTRWKERKAWKILYIQNERGGNDGKNRLVLWVHDR